MRYDYQYQRRRRQREAEERQRRREPKRGPLSVAGVLNLLLGLAAGFGVALLLAWGLAPAEPVDVSPDTLQAAYRADYVLLVAHSYAVGGDLAAAQIRLAAADRDDGIGLLVVTTEQAIAAGGAERDIDALVQLALALGRATPPMEPYLP